MRNLQGLFALLLVAIFLIGDVHADAGDLFLTPGETKPGTLKAGEWRQYTFSVDTLGQAGMVELVTKGGDALLFLKPGAPVKPDQAGHPMKKDINRYSDIEDKEIHASLHYVQRRVLHEGAWYVAVWNDDETIQSTLNYNITLTTSDRKKAVPCPSKCLGSCGKSGECVCPEGKAGEFCNYRLSKLPAGASTKVAIKPGAWYYSELNVDAGRRGSILVKVQNFTGNGLKLFVTEDEPPTVKDFDTEPLPIDDKTTQIQIDVLPSSSGDFFLGFLNPSGPEAETTTLSLEADYKASDLELESGQTRAGDLDVGDFKTYHFTVHPPGNSTLVELHVEGGDALLFLKPLAVPKTIRGRPIKSEIRKYADMAHNEVHAKTHFIQKRDLLPGPYFVGVWNDDRYEESPMKYNLTVSLAEVSHVPCVSTCKGECGKRGECVCPEGKAGEFCESGLTGLSAGAEEYITLQPGEWAYARVDSGSDNTITFQIRNLTGGAVSVYFSETEPPTPTHYDLDPIDVDGPDQNVTVSLSNSTSPVAYFGILNPAIADAQPVSFNLKADYQEKGGPGPFKPPVVGGHSWKWWLLWIFIAIVAVVLIAEIGVLGYNWYKRRTYEAVPPPHVQV